MEPKKKARRQFLKNSSLTALALSTAGILSAKETKPSSTDSEEVFFCAKTTLDYYGQGPFYTPNPPEIENNQLADPELAGDRMIISGRVFNLDCSEYIPDALIDVWHADHEGQYDNVGYQLRGQTRSNAQGFYMFETIKPGKYLNGSQFRPSHIHYRITAPGYPTLTTQLYFEGDSDIANDAAASITSGQYSARSRIIPLSENGIGLLEGTWDIVIDGTGNPTGTSDLHLDKGIVYRTSPNPFTDELKIRYGVYHSSQVSLLVFDMQGRTVATLEENRLPADQYTAIWQPPADLPKGHYFVALKINDLQVHYQKVLRI